MLKNEKVLHDSAQSNMPPPPPKPLTGSLQKSPPRPNESKTQPQVNVLKDGQKFAWSVAGSSRSRASYSKQNVELELSNLYAALYDQNDHLEGIDLPSPPVHCVNKMKKNKK